MVIKKERAGVFVFLSLTQLQILFLTVIDQWIRFALLLDAFTLKGRKTLT